MQNRTRKPYTWFIVIFVVSLLCWGYSTTVVAISIHYPFFFAMPLVIILTLFGYLQFTSYLLTVFTHPGYPPETWNLSNEQLEKLEKENLEDSSIQTEERKNDGKIRHCKTCKLIKPDRAHHCSICKQCVLKMDHHCPWVNNCVGFRNYKYFLLFLVYTSVCCVYCAITLIYPIVRAFMNFRIDQLSIQILFALNMVWFFFVSVMFGLTLIFFSSFQFNLLCKNLTTIESLEYKKKYKNKHSSHPYDMGWRKNFKSVMGSLWYIWFLPTQEGITGDGTKFEIQAPDEENGGLLSMRIDESSENKDV